MIKTDSKSNNISSFWLALIFTLMLIVGIPLLILQGLLLLLKQMFVQILIALLWAPKGINGVLLYSEHPEWHKWSIQLAKENNLVLLNWNKRKQWRISLATVVLYTFGRNNRSLMEDRQNTRRFFYPLAVVTKYSLFPKTVSFAKAWQEKFKGSESIFNSQIFDLQNLLTLSE